MTVEKRIDKVNAYPLYEGKGITAFEVSVWLSLSRIAQTLQQSRNVTNIIKRKWYQARSDAPKVDIQEILQLFIDAKLTHYLK